MTVSSKFKSGVNEYVRGATWIEVFFPVDSNGNADISCYQCKFFSRNNGICQINKEVTAYPTKYVGANCPLEIVSGGNI